MVQTDRDAPLDFEITLPGTETLLPRVQQLLTRITEKGERSRFECFFTAAAATIERLGDIDVSAAESDGDGPGSTKYWDDLGPVVRHSLQQLAAFLTIVRREFPLADEPESPVSDDDFSLDGPATPTPQKKVKDRVEEVADLFGSFCLTIGREHRLIQESIENDALIADRYNLLERLGEFRGRTRSGIGEMVFLAARLFAVVRKEDVVPFYKEDVEKLSLALRRGVTALRERVGVQRARLERLLAKDDQPGVRSCCGKCLGELDAFIRSPLFDAVRPADRRAFRSARRDFATMVENERATSRDITSSIDGIEKFLDSLSLVNHRELLLAHDREIIDATLRHLDALLDAVASDGIKPARESLRLAIRSAKELAGRTPALDVLLRLIQHVEIEVVGVDEILAMEQLVRKQL